MVNPSEVEKRIKRLIDIYGSKEELEKYDHDNQMLLKRNEEYLEKLKKLYSGTPIVVNEFDV
jgi:CMP-2-keto-3-deoxyoctulosonic acid synthetase